MPFVKGMVVTGLPHPLLVPEQNEGWQRLRDGYDAARRELEESDADLLIIYSTMWPSVVGHQIQADPEPTWVHVDELFHGLGSIPYTFKIDAEFAEVVQQKATDRGLHARTVAYHGFPIDTGSVVALKLLNPDNRIPAVILSSNVYADRAETLVLGKAVADAVEAQGRKAAAVVVTSLSNRLFTEWIEPADDRIHSPKDEEWNQKLLEFLGDGRLEDVAQLSRVIHDQIRVHKVVNFKPMWWLAATMGQHNRYTGHVHAYAPVYGTGGSVVTLTPTGSGVGEKEFDEDDVDVFRGDRNVIAGAGPISAVKSNSGTVTASKPAQTAPPPSGVINVDAADAPKPVGAYPHARRVGDLLYLSGVGPRQPGSDAIPGGPIKDADGGPLDYDIEAQTRAVIENVSAILSAAGSSLDRVVDVTTFLVDMDRDFAGYNAVYREYFEPIQAARTTVAISALPTPIAVELKVVALPEDVDRS
jgi:reactive intermediate/imine deaminase